MVFEFAFFGLFEFRELSFKAVEAKELLLVFVLAGLRFLEYTWVGLFDFRDRRGEVVFDCVLSGVELFVEIATGLFKLLLDFFGQIRNFMVYVVFGLDGDDVFTNVSAVLFDEVGEWVRCANSHLNQSINQLIVK